MQLYFVSGYTYVFPYFVHHTFRNEHILQQDYNCWLLLEESAIAVQVSKEKYTRVILPCMQKKYSGTRTVDDLNNGTALCMLTKRE